MKVLHVAGGLEPRLGGPAVAILNYVAAGSRRGIDSHLISAIDDPDSDLAASLRKRAATERYEITLVKRTGKFKGRMSRWGISVPLVRWLARHAREYDVIVTHGAWQFSSVSALLFGQWRDKAHVLIPHEGLTEFDVHKKGSKVRVIAKKSLKRLYSREFDLMVFGSEAEANQSRRARARARYAVVRYPLVDDTLPRRKPRTWASLSTVRVGYLGRIDPKKNIDVLLRALSLLPESFSVIIGGDGPDDLKRNLRSLAVELRVDKRTEWRGFVDASGKDEFFASIDVLVMPSQFESFGLVAGEALIHGVPAIVSPTTGAAELVGPYGGGFVVPATPDAVANALRNLLDDPQTMNAISAQAIATVSEHLSFSYIGAELKRAFEQTVALD
ncbi:MAG TPA: glycosyltransferase family 4 protein [Gemmatimonadaceae bacterium]|nr:glycosyltransferase family 4 protein [Gemmatimonadaceae bacterium]